MWAIRSKFFLKKNIYFSSNTMQAEKKKKEKKTYNKLIIWMKLNSKRKICSV